MGIVMKVVWNSSVRLGAGVGVGLGWSGPRWHARKDEGTCRAGGPILLWKTLEDVRKTNFSPILLWKTLILLLELI